MRNPYSSVSSPGDFKTSPGSRFKKLFSSRIMPDGKIRLEVSGELDIKKEINSHRFATDMTYIISRLSDGDSSVLNARAPMFGDFTQFPTNYADILNIVQAGEDAFNSLPVEVKNKFNNSKAEWFSSIGSDDWNQKMNFNSTVSGISESEVDISES